jgi:hypothetical protein
LVVSDHSGLAWLHESKAGSTWLDRLPHLVDECALADEAAGWAGDLPEDFERAGRPFEEEPFAEVAWAFDDDEADPSRVEIAR